MKFGNNFENNLKAADNLNYNSTKQTVKNNDIKNYNNCNFFGNDKYERSVYENESLESSVDLSHLGNYYIKITNAQHKHAKPAALCFEKINNLWVELFVQLCIDNDDSIYVYSDIKKEMRIIIF